MTKQYMDPERMEELKHATPARIGIGHAGSRCRTEAMLRFLENHAAANDAVFNEVSKETVSQLGVFEIRTCCRDKHEMLTRPDLGRLFDESAQKIISERCVHHPDVQIYFGDGLCAPSVSANVPDLYSTISAELRFRGFTVGTPFFVRYCRVNTQRVIGPLLDAKVVCVLIGERPGLLTSESMSAYISYRPSPNMSESDYTVVSNISRYGMPPVEAAAYIAELIADILKCECSGTKYARLREG